MNESLFYALLFSVAFLYASVGHGGASGYLGLMALFGFAPSFMRPSALLLNVLVSGMAFWQYRKHIRWNILLPLAAMSVPAAFIGGMLVIDQAVYKKLLGVLLLFPVFRFLLPFPEKDTQQAPLPWLLLIGACIGLVSGLIGIGGGIILTPLLLLLAWTNMKEAASISALFIMLNSLSGLAGTLVVGFTFTPQLLSLVAVAVAGGALGAYLGVNYLNSTMLKRMLAIALLIASVKLIFT